METFEDIRGMFTLAFAKIVNALPNILGALLLLIIGWIVAGLIARAITALLRRIGFNTLADRAEVDQFLVRASIKMDPAAFLGTLVMWFIRILFLVAAANMLGLEEVSLFLNQILAYLPNIAVAVIIFFLGALLARFIRDLTRGAVASAEGGAGVAGLTSSIVYWAVIVITVLTALKQLGIATVLTETLYIAIFGSVALALALAFGFGLRETAADLAAGRALSRNLPPGTQIRSTEFSGAVVEVGPTSTTLQSLDGQTYIVPNRLLANQPLQTG